MSALGIIPARYQSSRFPGKPLADIHGKSMIMRVYEQANQSKSLEEVVVATDDHRIFEHVESHGERVVLTSNLHKSGTDRCAEVAKQEAFSSYSIVVNIQGDEPFIDPQQIDDLVDLLRTNNSFHIATLAKRIADEQTFRDPNKVKVVLDKDGKALYFSRSPIPYFRQDQPEVPLFTGGLKHIGLYGFRRDVLLELHQLPMSNLELAEQLEQLRWLENGYKIGVGLTNHESIGVDSPADLAKVEAVYFKDKNATQ